MNPYSLISLFLALNMLYMGFFVYVKEPGEALNRTFLGICLTFALWAFAYAFVIAAPDKETLLFWYRLSALGWCNFAGFMVHFSLHLSGRGRLLERRWFYIPLYLPGAVFTLLVFSSYPLIAHDFIRLPYGWYEVQYHTVQSAVFGLYYAGYSALSGLMTIRWAARRPLKRERIYGRIYGYGVFLTLIPAAVINSIFPVMEIRLVPSMGYCFGFFWFFMVAYLILRLKMMNLNSSIAAESIMARIKDSIILTDHDGRMLKINSQTLETLGYREEELTGRPVEILGGNQGVMRDLFQRMSRTMTPTENFEIDLVTREGEPVPVSLSGATIADRVGEPLGVVIVGFDLRPTRRLQALYENLAQANRKLEHAHRIAERDMNMAINVQRDLFPARAPQTEDWDIAYHFQPAAGVSGDLFDFYVRENQISGAGLFDVSGHGIASGLITILAKSLIFRTFSGGYGQDLGGIMNQLNDRIKRELGQVGNYLTGILLRIADDRVEYANAGHPDLLLREAATGEVREVDMPDGTLRGTFLGILDFPFQFRSYSFQVGLGDVLLMYTDGLTEGANPRGELYGTERLRDSLKRASGQGAREILGQVMRDYEAFLEKEEVRDDLTVLVFVRTR